MDNANTTNRKQIHKMPEFAGALKLEVSFKISVIKLILYAGLDFDFKQGVPVESKIPR